MKKLIDVLLIGFIFISATSLTFSMNANIQNMQERSTIKQRVQQQKKDTLLKVSYTCPMHPEVIMTAPGKCPKCKMNLIKLEPVKKVYYCPMHPEVVAERPGKCPKCGMNLEKKEVPKKAKVPKV